MSANALGSYMHLSLAHDVQAAQNALLPHPIQMLHCPDGSVCAHTGT